MLPGIIIGIAYSVSCFTYKEDSSGKTCGKGVGESPCIFAYNPACGLSAAASAILEIADIMDGGLDFSKYDADLEGSTDFCSGGAG